METLTDTANTISPFMAILWCFYPIGALVFIELLLRAINDDHDDQDGGKGIRVNQAVPVAVPSGA